MQLPYCLLVCGVLACSFLACAADDVINTVDMENYEDDRAKRPFCNAFTGCGRKRSGPAVPMSGPLPLPLARGLRSDDPMTALFELNAEPAVAELSRQILSEAKLWEAIKEAGRDQREEARRQQQMQHHAEVPRPMGVLRSFRRRRSLPATPLSETELAFKMAETDGGVSRLD